MIMLRVFVFCEDDDVYKDEGDDDDEDIFVVDVKGCSKWKSDDYMDEDFEEEVLLQFKCVVFWGRLFVGIKVKDEEGEEEEQKFEKKIGGLKK